MEGNCHPVVYPPMSKALISNVVDMKIYSSSGEDDDDDDDDDEDDDDDDEDEYMGGDSHLLSTGLHRSPSVYAEAYGFDDEPWGMPQTQVYSNILTFTNHGCNGTANIGYNIPGLNEFTLDPSKPGFKIPDSFKSFTPGEYSPHRDRAYTGSIAVTEVYHPPILKGQELFDNYMTFGGDEGFVEQVNELKRDCTGALGTVELNQHLNKLKKKSSSSSPDPLHKRRRSKEPKPEDGDDGTNDGRGGSDEL